MTSDGCGDSHPMNRTGSIILRVTFGVILVGSVGWPRYRCCFIQRADLAGVLAG